MRVLMLESRYGTPDGWVLRLYHENRIYELADGLARHFVACGYARSLPDNT